jgi:ferredoxin
MKVTVDQHVCRGYANCVIESPEVFDIDDTLGKALVVTDPGFARHAEVHAAVAACPARAITIEE